jgi:hypothetical protein
VPAKPQKKRPGDPLVFDYRALPYGKFAVIQLFAFPVLAVGVLVYYQYYSKWRGGFRSHSEAYGPVLLFLVGFLVLAMAGPIRDLLTVRNERVEIHGDRLKFFDKWNRLKLEAKLSEIELLRGGLAVTSKVKRYVFQAGKQSFFFSADIGNVERLLKLLNVDG